MKHKQTLTCIICPIGCKITVHLHDTKVVSVVGNKCKKGVEYGIDEALNPRRTLTTSILVTGGIWPLASVKSSQPIPKQKITQVLTCLKQLTVTAPVEAGQIVISNAANTGVDIVVTRTVLKKG